MSEQAERASEGGNKKQKIKFTQACKSSRNLTQKSVGFKTGLCIIVFQQMLVYSTPHYLQNEMLVLIPITPLWSMGHTKEGARDAGKAWEDVRNSKFNFMSIHYLHH